MRSQIEITCELCGKTRLAPISDVKRGKYRFCSNRCRADAIMLSKRGVASGYKSCPVCKKIFKARAKSVTCSVECQSKLHSDWVKENQSGENNPFYNKKHTLETRKHLSKVKKKLFADGTLIPAMKGKGKPNKYKRCVDLEWRLLRDGIKARDGNKCVLCGSTKRLEVHHIIPYKICKKHSGNNLITLCREHHKETYNKEMEFVELFQNKLKGLYGEF